MSDISSVTGSHPIYPEGPACQPHCPGPWSPYHDGYADGYERAEREAVDAFIRDELPVLLTKATADYAMTYDGWFADQDGPILAAQIAALRTS